MNHKQTGAPQTPGPGIRLADVYYILFRCKWMILGVALLGFVAAGITYAAWKPTYSSTAKLYIPDIISFRQEGEQNPGVNVITTGNSGNVLESELEILTSLDNLKEVANILTPARIMAKYGAGTNVSVDLAAQLIKMNLVVESPRNSQVISVTFSSRASEIVQPVLDQVITNYIAKHVAVHLPPNEDWLTRENEMRKQVSDGHGSPTG